MYVGARFQVLYDFSTINRNDELKCTSVYSFALNIVKIKALS